MIARKYLQSTFEMRRKPVLMASIDAAQAIAAGISTVIAWPVINEDSYGWFTANTWVVQRRGLYRVNCQVRIDTSTMAAATCSMFVRKNGANQMRSYQVGVATETLIRPLAVHGLISCIPGDVLDVGVIFPAAATGITTNVTQSDSWWHVQWADL